MFGNHALVFYYNRLNTYSFNALAGAIDSAPDFADLQIHLALKEDQLHKLTTAALKNHKHVVLAFSILTCQFEEMKHRIRQLRASYGPQITILAGGPHVTACPEEVVQAGVDIAVKGEGETVFPGILRNIAQGIKLDSIYTSKNPTDLDTFFSISPKRGMFGPIEITRGCAFACHFCQTSHIFGVHLRHRSIGVILRQAEALRSINRKVVRLLSPNAFSYGSPDGRQLNLPAMRELLSALRSTIPASGKIIFAHFPSEARPEHINSDTLGLLKEFADNDEIVIGAQSGSQRMLDACHRSHTVANVMDAVSLARKKGYKVIVDIIFGLPGETMQDRRESLEAMKYIVRLGARIHPHLFAPLPQTVFAKEPPGNVDPFFLNALEELKNQQGLYENQSRMR
jgi:B12-binding domain/radical SAM domain protein